MSREPARFRWPGRSAARLPLVLGWYLCQSCGPGVLVPLAPAAQASPPAGDPQMRLVCRAPEPVRLRGTRAAYTDLDRALRAEVERAARPFLEKNRSRRPAGWDLLVTVAQAEASRRADRVQVAMTVSAELRTRDGQILLGQTQAYCAESAAAAAEAAPVFFTCLDGIGRDLSSWLGGVEP